MIQVGKAYKANIIAFQISGDSYFSANNGQYHCDLFELEINETRERVKAQFCRKSDIEPGSWRNGMAVAFVSKAFSKNQHTLSFITPEERYIPETKAQSKVLPTNLASIALKCAVEMHSYVNTLPYEEGATVEIINTAHLFLDFLKENS